MAVEEFRPVRTGGSKWLPALVVFIIIVTLVPFFLLSRAATGRSRLAYELTPTTVLIHFGASPVAIRRTEISEGRVLDQPSGGRRIMGTGMPGLYEGRWSFRETGAIRLYASRLDRLVVLETATGRWGITPSDPIAFLQALSTDGTGRWEPVPGGSPWSLIVPLVLLIGLMLGGGVGILVYYIRLPETVRYILTAEAVHIHGGRLRLALPYRTIDQVELRSPRGGPFRIFGAEVPGLLWGRFRWKDAGPNLRIYATQRKPLVLITSGGATYGISPEEGDRFVAEVQKRRGQGDPHDEGGRM